MKKVISISLVVITLISMLTIGAVGVNASNNSLSISQNLWVSSKGLTSSWSCKSAPTGTKYWLYWNKVGARGWNKEYVGTSTSYTIPNKKLQSGVKYKVQVLDFDTRVRKSGRISKVYSYAYLNSVRVNKTIFVGNKLYVGYTPSKGANAYQVAYKRYGTADKYSYKVVNKWEKRKTNSGDEYYLTIDLPSYLASSDIHVQVRPMLKTDKNGTAYGAYSITKRAKTPVVNKNKTKRQLEVEIAKSLRKRLKGIPYTDNMVAAFLTAVNYETGFRYEYVFNVTATSSTNSWSDVVNFDACGGMIPVSFVFFDDFLKTDWQASVDAQVDYLVGKLNTYTHWQKHANNAKDCLNSIMTEWARPAGYKYNKDLEAMLMIYGGTVNPPSGYIL